jgi:hypothetical protein
MPAKIHDQFAHFNPQKAYRERRKAARMCVRGCGGKAAPHGLACEPCAIKHAARLREKMKAEIETLKAKP